MSRACWSALSELWALLSKRLCGFRPRPNPRRLCISKNPTPTTRSIFCAARSPPGCRSARTLGAAGGWLCGWRGAQTAVAGARKKLGGEEAADGGAFWRAIREHEDSFFASAVGRDLWRVVLPPLCPAADFAAGLIEWEGRQRWLHSPAGEPLFDFAVARGGFATLFRAADPTARGRFAPLSPPLARLQRRIKAAFDPAGILNPGRRGDF